MACACCGGTDACCYQFGACGYYGCDPASSPQKCALVGGEIIDACGFSHPGVGIATCEDGGPASWTVTVTGALPNNPSDPADVAEADACNGSFVVDRTDDCTSSGTLAVVGDISVSVTMFLAGILAGRVSARIDAGMSFCANSQAGALAVVTTDCSGRNIWDCTTYALSAGNTGYSNAGRVDFSSATVALS